MKRSRRQHSGWFSRVRSSGLRLGLAAVLLSTGAQAEQAPEVKWQAHWPHFRASEYAATGVMLGGAGAILLLAPEEHGPNWTGGILFDDGIRDALRLESVEGRRRAQTIGTAMYWGSMAYVYAVDVLAVGLAVHGDKEVAAQMALIDTQAFALTGLLNFATTHLVARQRPLVRACEQGNDPEFPSCNEGGRHHQSFFGGHAAVAFTAAGLTCAHHQNLPLYGGGAPDILACAVMLANGVGVAWTRMMADKHYFTDNLIGMAIGLGAGYLMPTLLHYRSRPARPAEATAPIAPATQTVRMTAMPSFSSSMMGLNFAGSF